MDEDCCCVCVPPHTTSTPPPHNLTYAPIGAKPPPPPPPPPSTVPRVPAASMTDARGCDSGHGILIPCSGSLGVSMWEQAGDVAGGNELD